MMLDHIGQGEAAARIRNAWLRTVEDGVLTCDMAGAGEPVGTRAFAEAVIARLGQVPLSLTPAAPRAAPPVPATNAPPPSLSNGGATPRS